VSCVVEKILVSAVDGRTFSFTNAVTIRQLSEVHNKGGRGTNGAKGNEEAG
jgi:hypothetical protein